jgi:hypothetical protein
MSKKLKYGIVLGSLLVPVTVYGVASSKALQYSSKNKTTFLNNLTNFNNKSGFSKELSLPDLLFKFKDGLKTSIKSSNNIADGGGGTMFEDSDGNL